MDETVVCKKKQTASAYNTPKIIIQGKNRKSNNGIGAKSDTARTSDMWFSQEVEKRTLVNCSLKNESRFQENVQPGESSLRGWDGTLSSGQEETASFPEGGKRQFYAFGYTNALLANLQNYIRFAQLASLVLFCSWGFGRLLCGRFFRRFFGSFRGMVIQSGRRHRESIVILFLAFTAGSLPPFSQQASHLNCAGLLVFFELIRDRRQCQRAKGNTANDFSDFHGNASSASLFYNLQADALSRSLSQRQCCIICEKKRMLQMSKVGLLGLLHTPFNTYSTLAVLRRRCSLLKKVEKNLGSLSSQGFSVFRLWSE